MLKEREDVAKLLTVEQAAEYLGYHPETIRLLARRGDIRGRKLARKGRGGSWRFTREDLDESRPRLYDPLEEANER